MILDKHSYRKKLKTHTLKPPTMTDLKKKAIQTAIIAILLITAVSSIHRCSELKYQIKNSNTPEITTKTDTLWIKDTVFIRQPKYISEKKTDTLFIPADRTDTVTVHDTLYIMLLRQQRYYRTPDYQAWISGYRPTLDSLHIFRTSAQIHNTTSVITPLPTKQTPKRFGIGIQLGYGIILAEQPKLCPYVGVGISYNLWSL